MAHTVLVTGTESLCEVQTSHEEPSFVIHGPQAVVVEPEVTGLAGSQGFQLAGFEVVLVLLEVIGLAGSHGFQLIGIEVVVLIGSGLPLDCGVLVVDVVHVPY